MARPANADPAVTRARLLEAASDQFARRGLDATSLRDVARDAGVSVATINYYFGTKGELWSACLDAALSDVTRELAPLAALFGAFTAEVRAAQASADVEAGDVEPLIERMVRDGLRFGRAQTPALRLVMRTLLDTGELDPSWREHGFVPLLEAAAEALSPVVGVPAVEVRLNVQAIIALGMRYSLSTPRELARLAGISGARGAVGSKQEAAAVRAFEDHLVRVAKRLLLPGRR